MFVFMLNVVVVPLLTLENIIYLADAVGKIESIELRFVQKAS